MSQFNSSVWPPMIFPEAEATTGETFTATPGPAPPSALPQAVSTTVQETAEANDPGTINYEASAAAEAATYALFKIHPPTFPIVTNS